MSRLPTVKQLRYFIALEHYAHFGKAAEASYVSQSAFSSAIQALEKLLDVRLVDRSNKTVTITSMGKEIAIQARQCIQSIEHLRDSAAMEKGALFGRLNMGIIPTIAPFLLPKLMPALRHEFPNLQLYLREETTLNAYKKLMAGELDIILIALPYKLNNIEIQTLFKDHFFLAYHKNSRWITSPQTHFDNLKAESILLLEDGHCLRDHALSACKLRNQDTLSRFSASSLLTLIEMINSDLGISYLTQMAKDSTMLDHSDIKTYPLNKKAYREIGLAWRKGTAYRQEFQQLGAFIQKTYQDI
jgi:LysR family hydrogen peroxide-inducible transcriptional activator